jgi:hypothetical protein
MKTPNTLTLALVAFAGLSLAAAYAAPSYVPDINSPINTTPLNSSSALLNNYDDYIGVIDGYLTGTDTLLLPTPAGTTFPKGPAYVTAVAAAVAADPVHARQIVQAAVQYRGGNLGDKVKDILKAIATANPNLAEDAVIGASSGNPAKIADAAAGAVLGIIASGSTTADFGDVVDETVDPSTQALIEKIAKAAVSSAKKALPATPITAVSIAKALTQAVIADGGTLYIDDLARGLVAGANAITPTSQAEVAAASLDALNSTPYETKKFIAEFATGALKAVKVGDPAYTAVLNALKGSAVGASHLGTIQAVDAAHQALRNAPSGTEVGAFTTALNNMLSTSYAGELEAFMIGAVQNKSSKSGDFVGAMFNNPGVTLTPTSAKTIVGAAVRGKFTNAAKVTTAAINLNGPGFALSRTDAVAAAIPNATSDFAGAIAGAAIKTIPKSPLGPDSVGGIQNDPNQADDVASAALSAAAGAGYKDAINDIALQAFKARKNDTPAIVQTLVGNADAAGWREAIVAAAVINDKKQKDAVITGADLGAAAASLTDFDKTSLHVAANIAEDAKNSTKTIFDDSVEDFFAAQVDIGGGVMKNASEFTKAILFGRGGVNTKLAGPLLAIAMRYNSNAGVSSADILAISKAIYKKAAPALDIQYAVVQDALSQPDQLFDLVDHATATNLAKYAPDIAAAAAAARPEYAHIVARAGSFRSPGNAGKIGAAAITYGHMTNNRNASGTQIAEPDDASAVAAISAATILGIKDAKLPTAPTDKEAAAVKNAVGALVKAAAAVDAQNALNPPAGQKTIVQSNGQPGGSSTKPALGSAGAVTGIIAEIQGYGGSATNSLSALAKIAITAAIKADKKDFVAIAQAAAQAAQFVYQLSGGVGEIDLAFKADIRLAVEAAGIIDPQTANAVQFGVSEALANHFGAGAAGILSYQHHSGLLPAVTTLENF